jgi:hypothetical protein
MERLTSLEKSLKTPRIAVKTARGSGAFVALRFRCSALAKVSFSSWSGRG